MTARTNNGKNKQRQEQTTAKNRQRRKTGNGVKQAKAKCGGPSTALRSGRDDGKWRLGEGRTGNGKSQCDYPAAASPERTLTQKCNSGMAEVEWARCPDGPNLEGSAAPARAPAEQGDLSMHSLLVAALFVGMVIAPCVVAMFTGIE
jgi:hypothetical protein